MSENKRYYWYKMKTDFFEEMIIKFLKKQKKGDTMILLFQKIMLCSLKNDGYIYYKKMFPTFEEELALSIGAKPNIIKELLDILIKFEAIEKIDESTYYIKMIENCVGSETDSAQKMRRKREAEKSQCDHNVTHCSPEIEKDTEKETEKELYQSKSKTPASFSSEKKGGGVSSQKNYYGYGKKPLLHKGTAYDLAEIQKIINQSEGPVSFQKMREEE